MNKFRIVRDHTNHIAYFEYYVNTSYTTHSNTVNIKILGYHGAAVTLMNTVQTEEDSEFNHKEEISLVSNSIVGNLTGNASTATKLQTARSLWGNSFDGTADISDNISLKEGNINLKSATNGLSSNADRYLRVLDKNNYDFALFQGVAKTDGSIYAFMGVNNRKTDGTAVGWAGISISQTKTNNTVTYGISNPENFTWSLLHVADPGDLNNAKRMGNFKISNTTTNAPVSGMWGATWNIVDDTAAGNNGTSGSTWQLVFRSGSNSMWLRSITNEGNWSEYAIFLSDKNYTDYTVTKTGTGASGSWGISITGNAATATRLATFNLTGGNGNTGGFRLAYTWNIAAWSNHRMSFIVQSRHSGGGLVTISVGNNTSTVNRTNMYAEIKYWGPTNSGDIIAAARWQIYGSADGTKAYLFWNYGDYNTGTIIPLTDAAPSNGTWMETIDSSYGTLLASTEINAATSAVYLNDRTNSTASYLNYGASGLAASAITWLCCWNGYEVRAISKAEMANAVDSAHKWVRIGGDTMTGSLTVTSTGSNRANVNIRSATAVPMDLYLGSNNTNYWSISCRESTDPWLGFYWAGSSAGWALTMGTNRHVEIPVHAYIGGYNNTSYSLSTASFICNSWIRTTGSTGWYNESYGGGWYMTDAKWIRSFNSKPTILNIGSNNSYGIGGHRLALAMVGANHVSWIMQGGSVIYGFCVNNDGNWYFGKRTNNQSLESSSGDVYGYYGDNGSFLPYNDNQKNLGNSSHRWATIYGVKVYNAVWNDYAECRHSNELEPGRCVRETSTALGMVRTTQRLMPGCKFVSDTYGTLMGETSDAKTPIAVSGRVLAYPYRARTEYPLGAAVCSAPNGTVDIMTREEIMMYPERIVGTVSEIPDYEIWHGGSQDGKDDIQVNGRIWIYVR